MLRGSFFFILFLLVITPLLGQDTPKMLTDRHDQIKSALVRLSISTGDDAITRTGILMTSSGYILTEFDALDAYGIDYSCSKPGHEQAKVTLSDGTVYLACLVLGDFEHYFALLKIEANEAGTSLDDVFLNITPLVFDDENYLTVGDQLYAAFLDGTNLVFEPAAVIAMPLVPQERRKGVIQQRNYFTDIQGILDESLGGPVLNKDGWLLGMAVYRDVESNGTVQVVRVVPIRTICRVNADLCKLIDPDGALPPTDRTRIPGNVVLIGRGDVDLEGRAEMLCNQRGLSGKLADTVSGWGCWDRDKFFEEISLFQLDDLCKETYSDFDAFVLLSGDDAEMAYRWRCYRPAN